MPDIIFPGETAPPHPATNPQLSHRPRRRYRGKTVASNGVPRAHGGGSGHGGRAPYYSMCPSPLNAPDTGGKWPTERRVGLAKGATRHRGIGYRGWDG